MSSLSEHEHDNLNPNEPAYYAPRWLRDRSEARPAASREAVSEPMRSPPSPPASLDTQLEKAVSNALWHPLDPEVIREPPGLAEELDRGTALITVAGRFAAAVGVSAIVALFFVIMVPASRLPDSGGSSGIMRSIKSALLQPGQRDETSKPAIAEFQPILATAQSNQPSSPPASQPATREPSDQLLQQFMQWRQKPNSTETTQ
jgi:hypothetical protein